MTPGASQYTAEFLRNKPGSVRQVVNYENLAEN